MSSNGTSPSGGAGGGGGGPTFDQILFKSLQSDPGSIIAWTAMGAVAVGIAQGKILMDTATYYDYFSGSDRLITLIGVGLGTFLTTAHLMIGCAQTWLLAHHAYTDFNTINRAEAILSSVSDYIGANLNLAVSTYYSYRAYKMSGQKWWLGGGLMLLNTTSYAIGSASTIKGMTYPIVTKETATLLKGFSMGMNPLRKTWAATVMVSDGLVCSVMIFYLFKSRTSVFYREKKIYHKLVALVLETMLPPWICLLILGTRTPSKSSRGDWRKVLRMLLPVLYFVSLIHSLVARAVIRKMLDRHIASEDVNRKNATDQSTNSVFVASYHNAETTTKGDVTELDERKVRDLEASTEHIAPIATLDQFQRSASPISDASSKLKVNKKPFQ